MLTLINFLIIFFSFLILYQIFLAYFKGSIVEGMMDVIPTISPTFTPTAAPTNQMLPNLTINQVYRQYDKEIANNTFMLAQQNAGNIEYLKQRIDAVQGMNQQVQDLSGNVQTLQTQVNGLVQAQQDYANQMTGGTAPEITGTVPEDGSNVQDTSNLITE
jgi:TolA-binding protein